MARLHEYQGKAILSTHGLAVPRGGPASSPDEARRIASDLGGQVIVKIQAWTTNRKALGGVAVASTPDEAAEHAARMLRMRVGNFPVSHVLVEELLPIQDELFISFFIDDRERGPAMLVSLVGGSGIEERAKDTSVVRRIACDVDDGPDVGSVRSLLGGSAIDKKYHEHIVGAVKSVFRSAKACEARSVEVNPLVTLRETPSGTPGLFVMAADCRMTVDDYAVFRHPELGIEIARELDHPPTELERIAYRVEQEDHRGTFFFAQMNVAPEVPPLSVSGVADAQNSAYPAQNALSGKEDSPLGERGYPYRARLIGFHGAGGGGSMMSMDAITNEGFTIANFCDTSGNPSPAKVYRAARIILSQPGLVGYFGSGSGVANQEQFWSAYGLAKAFWEMNLDIPAVIRLGGNTEDRAVEILQSVCKGKQPVPAKVEGYKKTDPPAKIAARFKELVSDSLSQVARSTESTGVWVPRQPRRPSFVGDPAAVSFQIKGGRVWIDTAAWKTSGGAIVSRSGGQLKDDQGTPTLAVKPEEFLAKDSDMIACEVECRRDNVDGIFVQLDIPGLDAVLTEGRR